jgi:molybdopterin molybdotransferase
VGIIATGSELTPATEVPERGHIRDSNSYAMAACVKMAGGIPEVLPICKDTYEALSEELEAATHRFDFVITTGGAANGDFDFIKRVVADKGQLLMSQVNLRPGKAQTFGIVNGKPVFGLPGNPAAAYCGFEMLIRPALRKMQGYSHFEHPSVKARLTRDYKKKDPRRILLRSTLVRNAETGELEVTPAKNQSSGLFSAIQKSNCLAVMPEGTESRTEGSIVECILLDVPEEIVL